MTDNETKPKTVSQPDVGERIEKGTWVEIGNVALPAGQRAPQVPEDTQRVPLEMRVKGFLLEPAGIGDEVEISTAAGRRLRGRLIEANPAYTHSFGQPVPELSAIGGEVRAMLRKRGRAR